MTDVKGFNPQGRPVRGDQVRKQYSQPRATEREPLTLGLRETRTDAIGFVHHFETEDD